MFRSLSKGALLSLALSSILSFATPAAIAADDIIYKGDAKCTSCHDEGETVPVLAIGKTKHGVAKDSRVPTCVSCHGESDRHANKPEDVEVRPAPDRAFSKKAKTPVAARNESCLSCHQKDSRRHLWAGSVHESRDVACTSCHQVHTGHDKVQDKRAQPEVCYTCHKEQRAKANKPSHHPVVEGKMTCSDCHNAHGSVGPKLMKRDTVVETCYTCHMEKRGPFVHEHQPVGEDCSICHDAHGTVAGSLLKTRPPFLCQSCHTPHGAFPPAVKGAANAQMQPGWWNGSTITQGRSCMNCHTQVHGTNNPSTAAPTPQRLFR